MTGIEFNRHIEQIPIYPAASTYAFEGELVKLASNETPYPPHPLVLEAVEAQLRTLNRYPDPEKSLLRRRISERTGVPIGNVAVGNGSCEILLAAAAAMLEPGAELVYAWPSFSMYPQLAALDGLI
jgi:histidinol-phosphate aminotransferase